MRRNQARGLTLVSCRAAARPTASLSGISCLPTCRNSAGSTFIGDAEYSAHESQPFGSFGDGPMKHETFDPGGHGGCHSAGRCAERPVPIVECDVARPGVGGRAGSACGNCDCKQRRQLAFRAGSRRTSRATTPWRACRRARTRSRSPDPRAPSRDSSRCKSARLRASTWDSRPHRRTSSRSPSRRRSCSRPARPKSRRT